MIMLFMVSRSLSLFFGEVGEGDGFGGVVDGGAVEVLGGFGEDFGGVFGGAECPAWVHFVVVEVL